MIALTASTRPTTIIFHEIGISVSNSYITLRVHVTVIAQQDFIRVFLRFHMDRADRRIQSVLSPILHFFCHEGNTKLPKLHKQGCNLFPRPRETLRPHRTASRRFRPCGTVSNKLLLFFISGHAKCRKTDTDKHYQQNPYFFIALPPSYTAPRSRKQNSCCCTQTNPFWKSANFS